MGFISNLLSGVKKVGGFISNVSSTVGKVANVLSNVPVIGGFASQVAKGANLVNAVANGAVNLANTGEGIMKGDPNALKEVGKVATDIGDQLTGGAVSKTINSVKDGLRQTSVSSSQVQSNPAQGPTAMRQRLR